MQQVPRLERGVYVLGTGAGVGKYMYVYMKADSGVGRLRSRMPCVGGIFLGMKISGHVPY